MAKQSEKTAVPRLRFPEFRHHVGFGPAALGRAFGQITNGKANAQDHEEGGAFPLFDRSEVIKASSKFAFDSEVVILPGEGMSFRPRYFEGKFDLHQRAYALMECQGHSKYFYYALDHAKAELALKAVKSTVLSLRLPIIEKFVVFAPPDNAEQQKIADCLTSLDEVIAAQERKVEALKAHKRGLMQQLFPREGETRPRLRFPEFRDAPEWELGTLGDVCEVLNNRRVPISSSDRRPGSFPYYGASGVVDFVDHFIFDERLLLVGEDGAKWGAFEETAFIAEGKYWVNNHAHVLKPVKVIDTLLASYLTMLDLASYVSGHAPPKLTLGKLKSIAIVYPESLSEQQRIADCLSSLDTQIAAETRQLAALKTHKQGLMQQLFPAPEAD